MGMLPLCQAPAGARLNPSVAKVEEAADAGVKGDGVAKRLIYGVVAIFHALDIP